MLRITAENDLRSMPHLEISRQAIALVPQEPFCFAASITENITFGAKKISEAQVRQAAIAARKSMISS